ncbi:MAG TPA: serine hydrolase domain-containing protein, partial [Candidatus Methylomirabilis sp.]|nr:serine hydrolase domain-containing protein [Candidatus Methylomirabilis sp.]
YAGLPVTVLDRPVGAGYGYSNLGVGLLGHALERAAGRPFETLLRENLLEPLGMRRTVVAGPAAEGLATGYSEKNPARKATAWDLGCLAPAGGLASSVEDLARFVALQLRAGEAGVDPVSGGTLAELQTPQRLIDGWGAAVGLGWHVSPRPGGWEAVWHTGCVAGFHAYVGLARGRGVGVIFLANATREDCESGPRLLEAAVRAFGVEPPREVDPVLRKAIEEVSRHIAADPPTSLGDLFEANFLAQVPLPAVRSLFRDLHQSFGRCEGFEIVPGDTSRSARAVYRFSSRKKVPCDIEVESSGKIIYFFIRREES